MSCKMIDEMKNKEEQIKFKIVISHLKTTHRISNLMY